LRRPYGLSIVPGPDGAFELYVTDNYETPVGEIPPVETSGVVSPPARD